MRYMAVDIGNTTCEFALIDNGKIGQKFFVNSKPLDLDLITKTLATLKLDMAEMLCVISSVVPSNNKLLYDFLKVNCKANPHLITHDLFDDNLIAKTTPKQEVGIDILCKALWSNSLANKEALIVDLGSATVVQYMNKQGVLELVSISVGLNSMYDSLGAKAELLPKNLSQSKALYTTSHSCVNVLDEKANPSHEDYKKTSNQNDIKVSNVMGCNSLDAILGGVYWGYVGLINGIANKAKEQTKCNQLYLTGGRVEMLKDDLSFDFIHNQDIIFKGIDVIFKKHFSNL